MHESEECRVLHVKRIFTIFFEENTARERFIFGIVLERKWLAAGVIVLKRSLAGD